jgi:competence protein CoiA
MSFTALHSELGRIDATLTDLGQGLAWESVYRTRPRIGLTCPEYGHGVHAKLSPRWTRYFAHDPGRSPQCRLAVESADHHLLKLGLAEAIRRAGWSADLEVPARLRERLATRARDAGLLDVAYRTLDTPVGGLLLPPTGRIR